MNDKPQKTVYQSVAARGYTDGWTREQFAARQVAKFLEEISELVQHFIWLDRDDVLAQEIEYIGGLAKETFDDPELWDMAGPDSEMLIPEIASELADLQVVIFCLAEALGVDIIQAALDKAQTDIERGVR